MSSIGAMFRLSLRGVVYFSRLLYHRRRRDFLLDEKRLIRVLPPHTYTHTYIHTYIRTFYLNSIESVHTYIPHRYLTRFGYGHPHSGIDVVENCVDDISYEFLKGNTLPYVLTTTWNTANRNYLRRTTTSRLLWSLILILLPLLLTTATTTNSLVSRDNPPLIGSRIVAYQ